MLLFRGQTINARCQHGLHRRRHLDSRQSVCQTIGAWLSDERPRLHQGAYALFQEERIALGAGNQERREGCQAWIIPQQAVEELLSARWG